MSQLLPPILNPDDPLRPYTPPPKPKKQYFGKGLKVLKVTTLIIVSVLSLLVVVAGFMEDKIGAMVVKEVNKQLKTKLTVNKFGLSFISSFPNASANLEGVFLNDVFGGQLLKARTVSLKFSLFNLLSDNITINSVVIKDGIVLIKTDDKGRTNFDIVKPTDSKQSSNVALSVEKAQLQNVRFMYIDAPSVQSTDLTIKNGTVSGKFGTQQFSLNSIADVDIAYFYNKGKKFLVNKPLSYDARIAVDLKKNIYQFDNLALNIASNPLSLKGLIQLVPKKGTFINIVAQNKEGSLSNLLQLLPPQYSGYFKDFQSSGNLSFNTTIKGLLNNGETPAIQALIHFNKGRITTPKLKQTFENVSFDASFDSKKSVFSVENCKATLADNPIDMQLKVVNFNDPTIAFNANGVVPLSLAFGLFNSPKISDGTGILHFNSLKVNGRYGNMNSIQALSNMTASGNLTLDKATLKINGEPISADGIMNFNNNAITVKNFNVRGAGSDATFTGSFSNWLPVLLADSNRMAELIVEARLDADYLDVAKIVALSKPKPQKIIPQAYVYTTKGLPIPQYRKEFPLLNRLKGRFDCNVKNFTYNKITANHFDGSLDFTGTDLLLRGTAFAMGGNWNLDGKIEMGYRPHLFTKLTANRVNMTEFFKQCDNFKQTTLKSDNISGQLTTRMAINGYWDEGFNFLQDKLHVLADVNVTNGELVGFKLLENFSSYIKVDDLKKVKFTNLQNQLEIYKQRIFIPAMFIQSNALNLQISGNHSFNQDINYNLVLNAGQVLMSRFKIFNPKLDPQPDQRNGLLNLYYNINGTVDNFKYSSDKNGVKDAIANSEMQRDEIKNQLVKIFGSTIQSTFPPPYKPSDMDNPTDNVSTFPLKNPFKPNSDKTKQPTKKPNKKEDDVEYLPGF
jgi:AsmA-like C-terminal region